MLLNINARELSFLVRRCPALFAKRKDLQAKKLIAKSGC